MRAREEKEEKPMTLREVQSAYDADQEVTESQVRAALSAEAENVMNTTIPTPTQADNDLFVEGEIGLDDKEVHEVPEMPPADLQQELLDQAVPDAMPPNGESVSEPPVNVDVPHVGGTGTVGSTLTCTMGNWDNEPSGYQYEWRTDGSPNAATGASYVVAAGDAGGEVSCVVTATNAAGSTVAPESNVVSIAAATREMPAAEGNPGYETRTVPKR